MRRRFHGCSKTNAKVTISQQGRVILRDASCSGPFRIQDINDAVSGKLDVRVAKSKMALYKEFSKWIRQVFLI